MHDMAERFRLAGQAPSSLDDRARLAVAFELEGTSVGMRGFTEMAAGSLAKAEAGYEPTREAAMSAFAKSWRRG
jgi:hypothetical protein